MSAVRVADLTRWIERTRHDALITTPAKLRAWGRRQQDPAYMRAMLKRSPTRAERQLGDVLALLCEGRAAQWDRRRRAARGQR